MAMLDAQAAAQLKEAFADLDRDVELVVYTGGRVVVPGRDEPEHQAELLELLREVVALHDRLTVIERPLAGDEEAAAAGIEHAPTTVLREKGGDRTNIRFLGLPAGYEFMTLVQGIHMLGTGKAEVSEAIRTELAALERPVKLQTFVTPGCPYCPRAVLTGFRFAFHAPNVIAEGIEATGFPNLANSFRISSVPDTMVHGEGMQRVLGAQPDRMFLEAIREVAGPAVAPQA